MMASILLASSCISQPEPAPQPEPTPVAEEPDIADLIARGDSAGLQAMFRGRELANKPDSSGRYPLHMAVLKPSREMVEILLAMGAGVDPQDAEGKTPLRYAVDAQDAAIAKALIAKGSSIFVKDTSGVTPLDAGIARNFTASILDRQNVVSRGPDGETPLHVAIDRLSVSAVKDILPLEPDLALRDQSGRTALDSAFLHPGSPVGAAIAELLVGRNAPSGIDDFTYFIRAVRDTNYARARFAEGATVLHEAVRYDHRGYLSFFLERGVPVDAKNASGSTALHDAMRLGQLDAARILLASKADPNARDGQDNTPLHLALPAAGARVAIDALLAAGADPSLKDKSGNTALHISVSLGYSTAILDNLLAKGSPVDSPNVDGDTALAIAARRDDTSLAAHLVGKGAGIYAKNLRGETPLSTTLGKGPMAVQAILAKAPKDIRDDSGDSPFHHAIRLKAAPEAIRILRELGFDPSGRNNEGDTALHIALRLNLEPQGSAMLQANADPFTANAAGITPLSLALSPAEGPAAWFFTPGVLAAKDSSGNGVLHYAAMAALPEGVRFLADKGIPVDVRNADGQTPLMLALKRDSVATVNMLLSLGADSAMRDASGSTPLHLAVYWGAMDCLKLLTGSAAAIDPRDYTGKTPLRDAVDKGEAAAVAFLLENGASPLARDNAGKTPLHAAVRQADDRFIRALVSKIERVDARDDSGTTPLLEAVYAENPRTAKALVEAGALIHAKDASGESPLSYALKKGGPLLSALLDRRTAQSSDADGRSVLMVILEAKPAPELVELALVAGASPEDRDAFGRTPLHIAAARSYADIAALLVAAGADPFSRDAEGASPVAIALASDKDIVTAIFGSQPDRSNHLGETGLHYAAAAGLESGASFLLELGADKTRRNAAGETPEDVALRRGQTAIAELLQN
jgi:ankyrin repeat protein